MIARYASSLRRLTRKKRFPHTITRRHIAVEIAAWSAQRALVPYIHPNPSLARVASVRREPDQQNAHDAARQRSGGRKMVASLAALIAAACAASPPSTPTAYPANSLSGNLVCTSACVDHVACESAAQALHRFRQADRPTIQLGLTQVDRKGRLIQALRRVHRAGPHAATAPTPDEPFRLLGCFASLRHATTSAVRRCGPATAFLLAGESTWVKYLIEDGRLILFVAVRQNEQGHAFDAGPIPNRASLVVFGRDDVGTSTYPVSLGALPPSVEASLRRLDLGMSRPARPDPEQANRDAPLDVAALSQRIQAAIGQTDSLPAELTWAVGGYAAAEVIVPALRAPKYVGVAALSLAQALRALARRDVVVGLSVLVGTALTSFWTPQARAEADATSPLRVAACAEGSSAVGMALTAWPALELIRYLVEAASPSTQRDPDYRQALEHAIFIFLVEETARRRGDSSHPLPSAQRLREAARAFDPAALGAILGGRRAYALAQLWLAAVAHSLVEDTPDTLAMLYAMASGRSAPVDFEQEAKRIRAELEAGQLTLAAAIEALQRLIKLILTALSEGTIDLQIARFLLIKVHGVVHSAELGVKALCTAFAKAIAVWVRSADGDALDEKLSPLEKHALYTIRLALETLFPGSWRPKYDQVRAWLAEKHGLTAEQLRRALAAVDELSEYVSEQLCRGQL